MTLAKQELIQPTQNTIIAQSDVELLFEFSEQFKREDLSKINRYGEIAILITACPNERLSNEMTKIVKQNILWCYQRLIANAPETLQLHAHNPLLSNFEEFINILCPSGDDFAMVLLGFHLHKGLVLPKNMSLAIKFYEKAIQLGNVVALPLLASIYRNGEAGAKNIEQAILLLNSAILQGSAAGMVDRATMHLLGEGGVNNIKQTILLLDNAIALQNPDAMVFRAAIHIRGIGGVKNIEQAIQLLDKAIALGSPGAMLKRASMHQLGQGCVKNIEQAIQHLDSAVALGSPGAMVNRANIYLSDEGDNIDRAIQLLDKAVALEDNDAMVNRAQLHLRGECGRNYEQAILLLDKACTQGNAVARALRAELHINGYGGAVNNEQAILLSDQAIAQGNTHAMVIRAILHARGQGCPKNMEQAVILLEKAISKGNDYAMLTRARVHENAPEELKDLTAAARLLRLAAKNGGNIVALKKLASSDNPCYMYHHFMLKNDRKDYEALIILFKKDTNLINEFCEFECTYFMRLGVDPSFLMGLLEVIRDSKIKPLLLNKICSKLLITLSAKGISNAFAENEELGKIANFCLNELVGSDIEQEYLAPLTHVFVDLYWLDTDYKKFVISNLVKLISRINSLDNLDNLHIPIKPMAMILVQKIWGQEYDIEVSGDIRWSKLNLLAAIYDDKIKPDISLVQSLGFTWIQKKSLKRTVNEITPEYPDSKRAKPNQFFPSVSLSSPNQTGEANTEMDFAP